MKTLIVGGVAGGASAAVRLRRLNENAEIVIFEKGEYVSYANCGLPYYISGVINDRKNLNVSSPEQLRNRFNIDVRTGNEVTSIDTEKMTVTVLNKATGETYEESYDDLILAPGASPVIPPFADTSEKRVFVLNDIPDTLKLRQYIEDLGVKKAVVVGGGFIGLETAENLVKAGIDTTIIELQEHILPTIDSDMAKLLENEVVANGVHLHTGEAVQDVEYGDRLKVKTDKGEYETELLFLSLGVRPNTKFVPDTIEKNQRGAIITDEHMRTSAPHVYAVGDAVTVRNFVDETIDYVPLAGPANKQGRIAANNIEGLPDTYKGTQGSSIIKLFDKVVARTGLGEKRAKNAFKSYTLPFSHATYYPGAKQMVLKLIVDKDTECLLGAQAIGSEGVDKRIDVLATAIRAHMPICDIEELELCYAPPFSSAKDPVNLAANTAENIIEGLFEPFYPEEVKELQKKGEYILDVRTVPEHERGNISDNCIPLDQLRGSLDKLPKDRTIYVHCQVGLRGYLACRILMQNGFKCKNLSGGYSLYHQLYEI